MIINIPIAVPTKVGQFVPDCGSAASVGELAGRLPPEVGVAVGPAPSSEHSQSASVGHEGLRQYPL